MKSAIAYFRKTVNVDEHRIVDFSFVDSTKNVLVQLADLVAGSIMRSTKKNKSDSNDYLNALINKEICIKTIKCENSP